MTQTTLERPSTPTIFVLFGITGDLSRRKLLPALLSLYVRRKLPTHFSIVGFSRRTFTREEFRDFVRSSMNIKIGQYKEEEVKHFLDHIKYVQGMFDAPEGYERLATALKEVDDSWGVGANRLFHLSVPPNYYNSILNHISSSGLADPNANPQGGWTRILVEKPFGDDIHTAKELDKKLGSLFTEDQIFRIDHYLAKESLQNIIAFRFANSIFEPLWNAEHIDKIHIKLLEKIDIEGRGSFYDTTGALKDVGQNHVLQMLALIAMEEPEDFTAESIRRERARVLKSLETIEGKALSSQVVRGQYEGYMKEKGINPISTTETYFRIEAYIANSRWKNIPFYLESGKALKETKSEIDVYFKNPADETRQNVLTFRIQPDEGIKLRFWVKSPGLGMNIEAKTLKFKYSESMVLADIPDAYERLMYDAILGDQTLFASTEEVIHAWKFITPIIDDWHTIPLSFYPKGAEGVE